MERKENSYEIIDVSDITNVRFYTSFDHGSYIPAHWHRAVEIIYMQEGSLDVTVESKSFTISPEDCILINANVLHSTKCISPNKAIVLQIPIDFIENIFQMSSSFCLYGIMPPPIRSSRQSLPCFARHWNKCRSSMTSVRMDLSCALTVCSLNCFSSFTIISV